MLLTKEVEIKLWGANIRHFRSLGYQEKAGSIITVKVEDLPKGSNAIVEVLCDYCNKGIKKLPYYIYLRHAIDNEKIPCDACKGLKIKESNLKKYGVVMPSQLESVKEKMRTTCMERYGVDNYTKTKEFVEKRKSTCEERYGEDYVEQFIKKGRETFYEKTGFNHMLQSPEIKEKRKNTMLERHGVYNPLQSSKSREKIVNTLFQNSSQKASTQQRYICNLYQGILNYPVKYYNADIYLPENNLVCEFDGSGHSLNVKIGRETQDEFEKKELIRYYSIKRQGYKQMRIISITDKLPSDKILLEILEHTRKYFSDYPNHSWIEFDVDTSVVRNAEQKNGTFFDYGKLRKITKID